MVLFWGALWQWCIGVLTALKTPYGSFRCQVLKIKPWLPSGHKDNQGSMHMSDVGAEKNIFYLFHTEKDQQLLNKLTKAAWKLMSTG